MKRLMLVYNPVSGNASFKQRLDEMVWKFQERGCMLYLYRTAKELQPLPLYIRESGAEGVIAAGGDGTVHEIVNIIMKDLIALMDPRYIEVWGKFLPRGGISIDPYANYGRPGTKYEQLAEERFRRHDIAGPERVDNR